METLRERLMEADAQLEQRGRVWDTLRRLAAELDRLGVAYAVVGGVALQHHGIGRSTQDIDVLIDPDGLGRVHEKLVGHGYRLKSPGSRHLRDEVTRVRIEFLQAGDFPGDGRPKPVAFPAPSTVAERTADGIAFGDLRTLIELKLASAKSAAHRIKDRADVLELIHAHHLPASYAERLDPYVREEFRALAALPPPSEGD
jgi:hypothetical protein